MAKVTYKVFLEKIHGNSKYTQKKIYWAYQQTDRWEELRDARLALDNHRCRMCNAAATCVHHREYPDVYGEETVDDLTSLCHRCHENFHKPPGAEELKQQLLELAQTPDGTVCPVCETDCKVYPRSVYFNMAKHLIKLSRLPKDEEGWVKMGDDSLGKEEFRNFTRAEFQKLRHFGLIAKRQSGERRNGVWWTVTEKGWKFINNKLLIPAKVLVLNDKIMGHSDRKITIVDALETDFNYEKLMAGVDVQKTSKSKRIKKSTTIKLDKDK